MDWFIIKLTIIHNVQYFSGDIYICKNTERKKEARELMNIENRVDAVKTEFSK